MRVKYPLIAIAVLFIVGMLLSSSYAKIDPETCIGAWLFDEGSGNLARDSSGKGHDGKFIGNVGWVEGKSGSAVEFDGSSLIEVPHADDLTLEVFTLVAWVNIPVAIQYQTIVAKDGWPSRNYGIWANASGGIHHSFTNAAGTNECFDSKGVVTDGEWHHVAATYDGKSSKIYIDGVFDSEKPFSDVPATTNAPVQMGIGNNSWPLTGAIDEVAIFNIALNEEEIKAIMVEGLGLAVLSVSSRAKLTTTWGSIKKQ